MGSSVPADVRPPRLRPGMRIGVVAPSSPARERSTVSRGVERLERLGFRVVLGQHVFDQNGHLAGADADRAADLLGMLERDDVDAVMCMGGGFGASRTVRAIDLERLRRLRDGRPKPFIGYSDITALHALIRRELGWITFYGPLVASLARPTDYTLAAFEAALLRAEPFDVLPDPEDPYVETLVGGRAQGPLAGGCLALIASLIGTPWQPDLRGAVLFFEDVGETPSRVDRMLTHLLLAGALDGVAGIVIGEHADCVPNSLNNSLGLEQVFRDLVVPLGVPTIYHLPIGHGRSIATLPLGALVELDADARRLRVLEPGVV